MAWSNVQKSGIGFPMLSCAPRTEIPSTQEINPEIVKSTLALQGTLLGGGRYTMYSTNEWSYTLKFNRHLACTGCLGYKKRGSPNDYGWADEQGKKAECGIPHQYIH